MRKRSIYREARHVTAIAARCSIAAALRFRRKHAYGGIRTETPSSRYLPRLPSRAAASMPATASRPGE
jgi:hypothetical protein